MAQNTFRKNTIKTDAPEEKEPKDENAPRFSFAFLSDKRLKLLFGLSLIFGSIFLVFAMLSYAFTGKADQSVVEALFDSSLRESGKEAENWLGLFGAVASYFLVFKGFGISSILFMPLFFVLGVRIVFQKEFYSVRKLFNYTIFLVFWLSITFGYLTLLTSLENSIGFLGGGIGYELSLVISEFLGLGTFLLLGFSFIAFLVFSLNITTFGAKAPLVPKAKKADPQMDIEESPDNEEEAIEDKDEEVQEEEWEIKTVTPPPVKSLDLELTVANLAPSIVEEKTMPVIESTADSLEDESLNKEILAKFGPYDPRLDLANYQFPTLDLLKEYGDTKGTMVTKDELEENKNSILQTLADFGIGISKIHATIGPTVTLYEIIPEAGIKISKIANLSDDIALRLSALGVRIIAPMPGKGTIGIEVPNKNKVMVPAKDVLQDERFINAKMELPIAFGKTISNEVFVEDLTKMPHLLMAGATGMGKSVGINMLLASLLYKKHPSELKIVMVDPKKVELSLYNKIERHFLAKLPDAEEAILTDTKKVIHTLNSLCIEMDTRYSLLKDAGCRNLKEYNPKFVSRKLNPNEGHRYLPYIVVVIDELADLMITAGKEIEMPIARMAQLARAVGIHLVLATQRPSVNVITGLIKANFPARLSFRVTSKIDSKIILDEGGADQLIGKGDMLLKINSDVVRLQCAFLDTPEVENIVDFIGNQRGYEYAYHLPEYFDENADTTQKDVDLSNRDPKFEEAGRLVVAHQQGSTSLIQRKLALGYARSGRIMDQLEAAGIVGPPNGSKVREVLVRDEQSLSEILGNL
ncbi:MAG: DNA translocase FtsK 4TM domain-containing protein [Bacteroidota bacterium]|nr:DNA translocase FtsK 4TM domain-containing protein [Bacteroidota bacterium]